jgi:hypothetical protein
MSGPAKAGGVKPRKCAFFNTPGGCKKGNECPFKHVAPSFYSKYGENKRVEVAKAAVEYGTCAMCMNFECNCLSASEAAAVSMALPPNMKLYVCAREAMRELGFESPCPEGCAYVHFKEEVPAAYENIRVAHRDHEGTLMSLEEAMKRAWTKAFQNIQDNLRAVLGEQTVKKGKTKMMIPEWSTKWEPLVKELLSSKGLQDPKAVKTAEVAEIPPMSEEEELEAQDFLDSVLEEAEANLPGMNDGPDEVIVDWDEVDAEFQNEEEFTQVCLDLFGAFAAADEIVRQQEELSARMKILRAEEQRWIEACAQEKAARAARRSFAEACKTPVVCSPPAPRDMGALLGHVPRAAKKVPTVVPAEKGAAPTPGTKETLEEDSRERPEGWGEEAFEDDWNQGAFKSLVRFY